MHTQAFALEFQLSTSQTPICYTDRWRLDRSAFIGGFGTITDNGYGISYVVYEDYGKQMEYYVQAWLYSFTHFHLLPIPSSLPYMNQ